MPKHIHKFNKIKGGYMCECGKFIDREQAAISLSFAVNLFGQLEPELQKKSYSDFYRKIRSILKRKALG